MLSKLFGRDIMGLILQHYAASTIQSYFRRYLLFSHARQPIWSTVKKNLLNHNMYERLFFYHDIRREWRNGIEDWLGCTLDDLQTIREECIFGKWGKRYVFD